MEIPTKTTEKLRKALLILAVFGVIGLTAQTATADPLVFSNVRAFQNNDTVQVDLFSNPGTTLLGTNLTFSVDVSGTLATGAFDTLRLTYHELGSSPIVQEFQIPLFGTVNPPFTLIFSFVSPGATPLGVPVTLTVDLLNSDPDFFFPGGLNQGQAVNSFTYTFNVSQPVPEPATLLTLFGGMAALGYRFRRSK